MRDAGTNSELFTPADVVIVNNPISSSRPTGSLSVYRGKLYLVYRLCGVSAEKKYTARIPTLRPEFHDPFQYKPLYHSLAILFHQSDNLLGHAVYI